MYFSLIKTYYKQIILGLCVLFVGVFAYFMYNDYTKAINNAVLLKQQLEEEKKTNAALNKTIQSKVQENQYLANINSNQQAENTKLKNKISSLQSTLNNTPVSYVSDKEKEREKSTTIVF
jgi:predicted PurR-regulated permease PerM